MILKNKNAIITGCRRGIGRATLELFAKNGANVWACIRKQDDSFDAFIDSLMRMYNVRISPVYFDLADYEQIKNAVKQINAEKKNIDILVNNAGITYNALFQMTTMDKMEEVFRINYFSPLLFTQYISKIMVRQKRGNIINVASSAAIDANPGRSAYGASKAALICSSKAMAAELADKGIRVNVVAPGITNTDMVEESMSKEVIENTISETNLKRIGIPNDIAEAILFLSSDLSSYMTGQVLRVDGGM